MCTFMSQLPKKSKSVGTASKKNLVLSLKPCQDDKDGKPTWYRVRLLAWTSPEKNDRDFPFIERFVHQVWKKNDKGLPLIDDEVTCPVTKHVHVDGDRYDSCPICKLAEQYFITLKESGWKDSEARSKNRDISRKYQGIIPVYVKDDPNYPKNNGQIKAIIFQNKKPSKKELENGDYNKYNYYDTFKALVEKASQNNCVFNGKDAVDCCFHVVEKEEVFNKGQPNEFSYKHKVIDKITFTNKPYDIPSITKEFVTNSGFDEEYYTSSTKEELQAFYDRHYKVSNDDIPEDDNLEIYEGKTTKNVEVNNVENEKLEMNNNDISISELDSLTDDILEDEKTDEDNSMLQTSQENVESIKETNNNKSDSTDADIDSLLSGLDL